VIEAVPIAMPICKPCRFASVSVVHSIGCIRWEKRGNFSANCPYHGLKFA
jgi:hypothetical protein